MLCEVGDSQAVLQSTTMATARLDTAGIVVDGKNSKQVSNIYQIEDQVLPHHQIVCPRCGSKILPPKMGSYEVGGGKSSTGVS